MVKYRLDRPLTLRELQIREGIVLGKTNKEIGKELDISPRTVEDFRGRLMRKEGVRNAVELTRKFYNLGVSA